LLLLLQLLETAPPTFRFEESVHQQSDRSTPYRLQGNTQLEAPDMLAIRDKLKQLPAVQQAINLFWDALEFVRVLPKKNTSDEKKKDEKKAAEDDDDDEEEDNSSSLLMRNEYIELHQKSVPLPLLLFLFLFPLALFARSRSLFLSSIIFVLFFFVSQNCQSRGPPL
jgi:hypothetical protein